MNKNMNSPTKLTEFAPLSPEESQPVVASLFSKLFGFGKGTSPSNDNSVASPNNDEQSSSGDSDSWKCTDGKGTDDKSQREEEDDDAAAVTPAASGPSNYPLDASEGRSLPNVLKRISNIVALKSNNLKSYKDSQLRSFWMPDSVSKQCYECGERFTTFRRRHHCRVCGQIFCSKCCSDEIPGKIMGCTGDLRVCTYCCKVVLSYLQSSDMRSVLSADLKALQEDLQVKYGRDSRAAPQLETSNDPSEDETRVYRKASVGYMEEKYALGRSSSSYLGAQERSRILQNSTPLRMIYEELFRSSNAIPLQTHRVRLKSFHNCFTGNEFVNWIISHNKAATRIEAIAIGQALSEAGFIESAQSENNPFGDGAALFKPIKLSPVQSYDSLDQHRATCDSQEPAWVKNIPQHDSATDSESETKQGDLKSVGRLPSSSSSFYLDLDLEASTVTLKRPTFDDLCADRSIDGSGAVTPGNASGCIGDDNSTDGTIEQREVNIKSHRCSSGVSDELLSPDTLQVQEFKERNSWHDVTNLRSAFGEMSAYNALTCAYKQHENSLIGQLLNKEGLSEGWIEPILSLAHDIVDHVRPDMYRNAEDMDIRHYVQIKKSPGGTRNDCEIVSGVVCSKNVAHRGMNAMIANPKILLLKCGLTYHRAEGSKLLTLEPVMLQENEYLGHTVARIAALGPDVVLVHRSVSRLAQDRFRQCGVTLVLNVKISVLERVARCTGGAIVGTIDELTTRYKLGTCQKFYLRNFPNDKNGFKTLMYFEGCPNPHLGATILLRGGSRAELKRVKKVASTMIFASYSWRLEKSFLMDEFAKPPSQHDNSFLEDEGCEEIDAKEDASQPIGKKLSVTGSAETSHVDHSEETTKSTTKREQTDAHSVLSLETLKRVSTILGEDADPYDTLKLFKTGSKQTAPDEKRKISESEYSETSGASKLKDKIISEDKRVYGESVSDRSDPLHQYLNEGREGDEVQPLGNVENVDNFGGSTNGASRQTRLSVADLPLLNKFKKALDDTTLSLSPYLKFSIPYLETEPGRNCALRRFFPKEIFYSVHLLDKVEGGRTSGLSIEQTDPDDPLANVRFRPKHSFVRAKFTSGVESRQVQALLANFRACGSRLSTDTVVVRNARETPEVQQQQPSWPDCLEPENHQRLSVTFCSFCHNRNNAPAFCVNPSIVKMDLYGRNDIALGRFLEHYCLTSEYKCPAPNCRAQIGQHARRFAHEGGCVHISLTEMSTDPFGNERTDKILMWTKCLECKSVSPVVPMSSDTWSLSFAKYLELRFHGRVYTKRSTSDICRHSLHHRHCQYFTRNNMLAIFKYTEISQWEISLPPPVININYDAKQHDNVIEEIKSLALTGDEVFTNIRDKLSNIQQIESESTLNSAKQQLAKDQQYFKNKIEEIQLKLTSPTLENKKLEGKSSEKHVQSLMFRIEDGIVISKRLISEAVSNWNDTIQELTAKKKDDRPRRFTERASTIGSGVTETDGYTTEDTESQMEDSSPISADYNAIDAISSVHNDPQPPEPIETSDEIPENANPEDIVVLHQESPKFHRRSHSDVLPITSEDPTDRRRKNKKRTILEQLLPSTVITNPITNPLASVQHHLLPHGSAVPMVVYESEPSSIIAYALDSNDYKHALAEILRASRGVEQNSSPLYKRKFTDNNKENNAGGDQTQSGEFKRPSVLSFLRGNSPSPASPMETDKILTSADGNATNPSSGGTAESEEDKRAVKQQTYIEVQFNDATTNFYCRIYFAAQFAGLREYVLPCGEDGFVRSLCRSVQWAARGGKSGSAFRKSRDDRFILKELTRLEIQIFLDFAPNYFAYMEKCQQTKQPTLLGKIVGVYRVSFKNNTTNAALRTSVLVMENLFYGRAITDKFDLKGSVRNRLVNPEEVDSEGELVLLDENLLNMSCDSPLYIRSHSKAVLNRAIERDTKFLSDNSVMDYSLLVGLEPTSDELVLGIIDYIRTFTWDKKLETMVKKSGILGGQGKLPTIVSPEEYRARFIAAMHRYFLPVPDRWTDLGRGVVESPS